MALNYTELNNKYLQAKEVFNSYTINFSQHSASGIISAKKIRKINIIAMWMDYIQNSLKYQQIPEYSKIEHFLDLIAIELKINLYETAAKVELDKSLSSAEQYTDFMNFPILESEVDSLLTEGGETIDISDTDGEPVRSANGSGRNVNISNGNNGSNGASQMNSNSY